MVTQEHIHVYEPVEKIRDDSFALPFHTDRGLLLMVTHSQVLNLSIDIKCGPCTVYTVHASLVSRLTHCRLETRMGTSLIQRR